MNRLCLALFIILTLFVSSCSDSGSENVDDLPKPPDTTVKNCKDGTFQCKENIVQICKNDTWVNEEVCNPIYKRCKEGFCVSPPLTGFFAEYHKIPGEQTISIDFTEAATEYVLVPFSLSQEEQVQGYNISLASGDMEKTEEKQIVTNEKELNFGLPVKRISQFDKLLELQKRNRLLWKYTSNDLSLPKIVLTNTKECQASSECSSDQICHDGECKSSVPTYIDAWTVKTKISAKVLGKSENCTVLIDTGDEGKLTPEEVSAFLDVCENIVVPRGKFFFGESRFQIEGETVDLADKDNDGTLHILFSHHVNTENVWGYFSSADFFPAEQSSEYRSNERDVIYLSLPEDSSEISSLKATIVHEYQHLIHFVNHTWSQAQLKKRANYNPIWLDEAMAHLSEEICGYGVDNPEFTYAFLSNFENYSFQFGADSLGQRTMGMMLLMYLFEQKGGVEYNSDGLVDKGGAKFLKSIIYSEKEGMEAIEEAFGKKWDEFFFDWLTAIALDGTGISDDEKHGYAQIITDKQTGNEVGFLTHGERKSKAGKTLTFTGPHKLLFSSDKHESVLSASSAEFLRMPERDGLKKATIVGPEEDFYLGIIRVQ